MLFGISALSFRKRLGGLPLIVLSAANIFHHCNLCLQEYLAPEILSHLSMHGTSVSEVIKHLLTVLRNNGADVARLFLEALKRVSVALVN